MTRDARKRSALACLGPFCLLAILGTIPPPAAATSFTITGAYSGVLDGHPFAGTFTGTGDDATGTAVTDYAGLDAEAYASVGPIIQTSHCRIDAARSGGAKNLNDLGPAGQMTTTTTWPGHPGALTVKKHSWQTTVAGNIVIESVYAGTTPHPGTTAPAIVVAPFDETWVQVAPGVIRAVIDQFDYTVDGVSYTSHWETEITVAGAGIVPGLATAQHRHTEGTERTYDAGAQTLRMAADTTLEPTDAPLVPTLSQWGAMALGGGLVVLGTVYVRRRSK